jgi:hypothetical protein
MTRTPTALPRSTGAEVLRSRHKYRALVVASRRGASGQHRVAERIVAVARPKDAIEEFLTRRSSTSLEILRLRRLKTGVLRASSSSGITRVMNSLDYDERKGYETRKRWSRRGESPRPKSISTAPAAVVGA